MTSSLQKAISLTRIKTHKSIALKDAVVGQSVNMLVWDKMVHFYVKFSAEQKYQVVSAHAPVHGIECYKGMMYN